MILRHFSAVNLQKLNNDKSILAKRAVFGGFSAGVNGGLGGHGGAWLCKTEKAPPGGEALLVQVYKIAKRGYFWALVSTTSRSSLVKSSMDMAPRSPSVRWRGETVPFSISRSPTTTM